MKPPKGHIHDMNYGLLSD